VLSLPVACAFYPRGSRLLVSDVGLGYTNKSDLICNPIRLESRDELYPLLSALENDGRLSQ
jgi:hypothetical protein